MPKSKFFRVATEGATCDGRFVERAWIEQMAAQYDPKLYGARVNMEHFRTPWPNSDFGSYGDVLALKTEEVDGKLVLLAQLDPTDRLVDLVNVQRQKVYTSIEINPNFADTGKAYLMGIAVTDTPASLGVEMLQFCASAAVNPLAARKQDKACLFTAAEEAAIEFEQDAAPSILTKMKAMLAEQFGALEVNLKAAQEGDGAGRAAIGLLAEHQKGTGEAMAQFAAELDALQAKLAAQGEQLDAVKTAAAKAGEQAELAAGEATAAKEALAALPATTPRAPATGAQTDYQKTDC